MEPGSPSKIDQANAWVDEHNAWINHKKSQYGYAAVDLTVPHITDPKDLTKEVASSEQPVDDIVASATTRMRTAEEIYKVATAIALHQRAIAERETGPIAIYASQEANVADAVALTAMSVARYQFQVAELFSRTKTFKWAENVVATAMINFSAANTVCEASSGITFYQCDVLELSNGREAVDALKKAGAAAGVMAIALRIAPASYLIAMEHDRIALANHVPLLGSLRHMATWISNKICPHTVTQYSDGRAKDD